MKLTNEFEVPVPAPQAWVALVDVERIVPCMPGAELVERVDDDRYKGRVSVQLGPVRLVLEGIARFVEIDAVARRARVDAQGTDKKGRGGAHARIAFQLLPEGNRSRVVIETDVQLSGSIAQYGRASGLIAEVAKALTAQFAQNLARDIGTPGAPDAPAAPESDPRHAVQSDVVPISGFRLAARVIWSALGRFLNRLPGRG